MSRLVLASLLAAAAAVPLLGCGDAGRLAEQADVDNRQYIAVDETGADLTLGFSDGHLSASGGCNGTGGPYSVTAGRISQPDAMQTLMGCSGADRDDWLNDLIDEGELRVFEDGDRLELARTTTKVVFRRQGPTDGPTPVEGPTWTAGGFVGPMKRPTIRIGNGRAEIFTGCNRVSAAAEYADGHIEFSPLTRTKEICPGYVGRAERMVLAVTEGRTKVTFRRRTEIELEHGSAHLTLSVRR